MRKITLSILPILLLHVSAAWPDEMTVDSETLTNTAPFSITISGCRGSSPVVHYFIGSETHENVIDVYAYVDSSVMAVGGCYVGTHEIGPFASGSYTLNYYTSEWSSFNLGNFAFEGAERFRLQVSQTLEIAKSGENEPALGRILIDGEAEEDQVVTANHSISDRNGMGTLSFQWYRATQPIPYATHDSYLLTDDDAGYGVYVTASFVDGQGNQESVRSLPVGTPGAIANINDPPAGSAYISGSLSEGSTLTIDTSSLYDADGMGELSYAWKRRYGAFATTDELLVEGTDSYTIVPYIAYNSNASIVAVVSYEDLHGTKEILETIVAGRVSPASRPIVTPPADMTIPATGVLTRVDPGTATARDDDEGTPEVYLDHLVSNGVETPPPGDGVLNLASGTHLLYWAADDSLGRTSKAIQIVRIEPIIEFGADQVGSPDGPIGCPLELTGTPARYPISAPYSLTAIKSADASEVSLQTGTFRIGQAQLTSMLSISQTLLGDLSDYASLRLTIDPPSNAVMGNKNSCQISVSNENYPPKATLTATQDETPTRIVNQTGGSVIVTSKVQDLNISDNHSYDWSGSDTRLADLDNEESSFTFDPSDLEPGLYRIRVRVSDATASDNAELSLMLVTALPQLTSVDSDADGETDLAEGYGDSDADGIPNYLDPAGLPGNTLQQEPGPGNGYMIQTVSGLTLALGDIALFTQHGALVSYDDILDYNANSLEHETYGNIYPYEGDLFDFRIDNLTQAGMSAKVVIPQLQSVSPGAAYYKLTSSGWREFVVDEHNLIKSAPGSAGVCPPPGDSAYTSSLRKDAWCVELTIEDGGPNDTDGLANKRIADTGGIITTASIASNNGDGETGSSGGGGGILSPWGIVSLVVFVLIAGYRAGSTRRIIRNTF